MFLEVKNLTKKYEGKKILENINFSIEKGEILCILGPSGCGKTTILNTIGGFSKIDSGEIYLEGENITKLSPEQRKIATVFQSYGLFTHKNVYENVEYGLKFLKLSKKERKNKVMEILKIVNLEGYEKRKIYELSGGQQQRIALARSMVINPSLILLDEPFSNLDENLKDIMRKELKKLVNYFNMTAILVTHDQEDAFTIADKVILMNNGKIVQHDEPKNLYNEPNSEFSLQFIGKSNIIDNNSFIRPEKIKIHNYHSELGEEYIKGEIVEIIFKGMWLEYKIKIEENKIINVFELNNENNRKIGEKVLVEYRKKIQKIKK